MQRLDLANPVLDCYDDAGGAPDGDFGRKKLWDGYEISIQPDPKDADNGCSATIYNANANAVYGTNNMSPQQWSGAGTDVILDPSNGLDVDGDGSPDVVLRTGSRGNGGSSWQLDAISLKPQAHILFSFGGTFVALRKDPQARVVLWSGEPIELAGAYRVPNADVPVLQRAYRFSSGKLTEVTPDYCATIDTELFIPSSAELQDFKSRNIDDPKYQSGEAADVLNVVFQEIFCHRFDQALTMVDDSWPPSDRASLIQALQKESSGWKCAACQAGVASWH